MIITVFFGILLSFVATALMSYIAMATPIGPWIAPILVLIMLLCVRIVTYKRREQVMAFSVATGSIGGIVATGLAFSLPTLYFLDAHLFANWMISPVYFSVLLASIVLAAGSFGLMIAHLIERHLIVHEQLAFPIGQLVYQTIVAHHEIKKAYELLLGFLTTTIVTILKEGCFFMRAIIPQKIVLLSEISYSVFTIPPVLLEVAPMFWAIGFIAGSGITLPLALGAFAKIGIADPLHRLFFSYLSSVEFILAFCSGMVLQSVVYSFWGLPQMMHKLIKKIDTSHSITVVFSTHFYTILKSCVLSLCIIGIFFYYFAFPFSAQLFILVSTFLFTYQVALIAGKMGIAPLGRFATFVMIPAMLLFNLDYVQIVLTATFVEVCAGVCADALFSCKMARLGSLNMTTLKRYQWIGLVISACCVGLIFWFLIQYFALGSSELFAQRAQNRTLLIQARAFNYWVLAIGIFFGFLLHVLRINGTFVLGGLLMPLNLSLGLVIGGCCTFLVRKKEDWFPFWSGVLAAGSLWMLLKAFFNS